MYTKKYLIAITEITESFGDKRELTIEAVDEEEALEKAKYYVSSKKDFADLVLGILGVDKKNIK